MKTGLETKAWKILTRPPKRKISDEANAVLFLTALARAASADTNVSVPELKKVQEIMKRETGFEVVSFDVHRLKTPTARKGTFGKVCVQVE